MAERKFCAELVFSRNNSQRQKAKIREFWEFLDSANNLQPRKAEVRTTENKICREEPSESKTDTSTGIWYNQLITFHQFGLDKTALAADEKTCKMCSSEATYRGKNFADEVAQPYEELNEEIKAFEERLQSTTRMNSK